MVALRECVFRCTCICQTRGVQRQRVGGLGAACFVSEAASGVALGAFVQQAARCLCRRADGNGHGNGQGGAKGLRRRMARCALFACVQLLSLAANPMSQVPCAMFHVHHSLFDPSSCPALGQLLKTRAKRRHGRAATMVGLGPARCSALPYAGRPPITLPGGLSLARLCLRLWVRCRQPGPEAWPVCPSLARTT